ncbi:MAG: T9SS type A sorting domain-containing protein [Bacteroidetes bacterium]|nr:T9SS type A sorting domain-containing protein [Bacteroidota bacterium]
MNKKLLVLAAALIIVVSAFVNAQTVIPNSGFENWTTIGNYSNPTDWDSPNEELMSIPFFGFQVLTKSTDHQGSGSFSAKLETKHLTLPPLDVPGFMTCGKLTVDIASGTFVLSGGAPVIDKPTHLKGFYKYIPKGGDSCLIGIGMFRTVGGVQDSIGFGYFSTKDTINDWTPFSAWIDYLNTDIPDTMNIIAMSTAQEVMTPGTVLFVDNLFLDYTVGAKENSLQDAIQVYNDRETQRLIIFLNNENLEFTKISLYDMTGRQVTTLRSEEIKSDRRIVNYQSFPKGIYLLEILRGNQKYVKKFFLNF